MAKKASKKAKAAVKPAAPVAPHEGAQLTTDDLSSPGHDSTPTIAVCGAVRIRGLEVAKNLEATLRQGYIEISVAKQLIDLAKDLAPLLKGAKP